MFLAKCVLVALAVAAASGYNLGGTDVVFHLFSRDNPTVSQPLLPEMGSLITSSFALNQPMVITIHDFGESVGGNFNAFVIPAHLAVENINLIAVDWSNGASMYTEGLGNAPQCGQVVAQFANILVQQFNYNPEWIRIVGVGLGGHIAGIAARNIAGTVPYIVAIDPSLHGWAYHPERLSTADANLVEVLHTTAGIYGYDEPLGHIDFYANGGSIQPNCWADVSCSHIFGYIFYEESVRRDVEGGPQFVGTKCEDYQQAMNRQCTGERDAFFGGSTVKTGVSGIYSFNTNNLQPFAMD